MDENKKQKLKEMIILEDEKSLLLSDKIDAVKEKMEMAETEICDDIKELKQAIQDIPPVPEPPDHTEKLEEMAECMEKMEKKMGEEVEIILQIE